MHEFERHEIACDRSKSETDIVALIRELRRREPKTASRAMNVMRAVSDPRSIKNPRWCVNRAARTEWVSLAARACVGGLTTFFKWVMHAEKYFVAANAVELLKRRKSCARPRRPTGNKAANIAVSLLHRPNSLRRRPKLLSDGGEILTTNVSKNLPDPWRIFAKRGQIETTAEAIEHFNNRVQRPNAWTSPSDTTRPPTRGPGHAFLEWKARVIQGNRSTN